MKVLFEHRKNSDNYYNTRLFPLFIFPIFGIIYLWEQNLNILIKIIGSILLGMGSISIFKNTPYQKDSIILTNEKIEILKNNKKRMILIDNIKSVNSNSRLSIMLKSGNQIILKYSDWMIGMQKAKELNMTINKLIEKNTTDNN